MKSICKGFGVGVHATMLKSFGICFCLYAETPFVSNHQKLPIEEQSIEAILTKEQLFYKQNN